MPYLEIYPIENYAEKLSSKLDVILEAKPTMYNKTKERYRAIAYSLLQSVEKISSILEEASLIADDDNTDEFDELSLPASDTSDQVDLEQAVHSVKKQVKSYTEFSARNNNKLNPSQNKVIISTFARILSQSSGHTFKCKQASECAHIINKWFKVRFTSGNKSFKYSIKQIPEWIYYIILLYGKYHTAGDAASFVSMFNSWCAKVQEDSSVKWAVPYEVYDLMKSTNPNDFTLAGVVISDILMDESYYQLTESYADKIDVVLGSSAVANIVKDNNSSLVSKIRTRLSKQDDLIIECKLDLDSSHISQLD